MRLSNTRPAMLATALAAALALSACGGNSTDSDPETTTVDAGEADGMGMPDAGANAVAMEPQAFVEAMAASDRFEIESARIAQGKSPPTEMREFAAMMIRDHTASTNRLKTLLANDNAVSVPATPMLTAAQQTQLEQLRAANGADFAALYGRQQVAAHENALSMLTGFAASGSHAGLSRFASETAETVRGHLSHVQRLTGQAGNSAGATGPGGTPRANGAGSNNPNGPNTSVGTGTDTSTTGQPGTTPPAR